MNLKQASFLAGAITLFVGLACLACWLGRLSTVILIAHRETVMAPNTAIAFSLAGLTLMLLAKPPARRRILTRGTTCLLAAICFTRLLEFSLGQDWGVDEFFISFRERVPALASMHMASVSALCFLLIATGFAFLLWRGKIWAGDVLACSLAIVVGIVGGVFLVGFMAGAPVLFAFDTSSMAVTTAALFVVLATGLLCAAMAAEFTHTRDPLQPDVGIPLEKKLSAGVGAAFGVVVLMGLLSYNTTVKFIESSRWVEHTQRMLTVLEDALSNLAEAESNQRGYILTGQASFLEPCRLATAKSRRRFELLLRLTADYPQPQQLVTRLVPLVNARLTALRYTINLRQVGQLEQARRLVAGGGGRRLMEQIREEADTFRSLARTQLAEQAATREASRTQALFTYAAAAITVAAILLGVYLLVARDLSGRRQAEAALHRHNDTLRCFAHTVAHDLRAPLRGIGGYARELSQHHGTAIDERGRFCAAQIAAASVNLEQLIQDTLDFAQLDGESARTESVDLPALIQALLQQREPQIREHGAEIATIFHATRMRTWRRGLEQVLANLLDNALKYSRHARPPCISIETGETADGWLVTVRDNGIGFDMRHHDRIFGLFQRLVSAAEFEGTGAGLAISKKITDRLGGSLRAEAKPGEGARFVLQLPKSSSARPV